MRRRPMRTARVCGRGASCHGTTGDGGELGPSIVMRVPARTDAELTTVIRQGAADGGHAGVRKSVCTRNCAIWCAFLRTLRPRQGSGPSRTRIVLVDRRFGCRRPEFLENAGIDNAVAVTTGSSICSARKGDPLPPGHLTDGLARNRRDKGLPAQRAHTDFESNVARMIPRWISSCPIRRHCRDSCRR